MEQRRYGTNPLAETKAEAEEKVDKKKRYHQIITILSNSKDGMTAKEIACEMNRLHYTPTSERNFASPRLTEMLKFGLVDCVGKKKCDFTGVKVGVFKLREGTKINEI